MFGTATSILVVLCVTAIVIMARRRNLLRSFPLFNLRRAYKVLEGDGDDDALGVEMDDMDPDAGAVDLAVATSGFDENAEAYPNLDESFGDDDDDGIGMREITLDAATALSGHANLAQRTASAADVMHV